MPRRSKKVVFRDRCDPPRWGLIADAPSINHVVKNGDVDAVQQVLDVVAFSDFTHGDPATRYPREMTKALEYAQLTIEYLLNVQESLSRAVTRTKDELDEESLRAEESMRNERLLERKLRHSQKKLRNTQTTLHAATRMLAQFGVDTSALQRMGDSGDFDDDLGFDARAFTAPPASRVSHPGFPDMMAGSMPSPSLHAPGQLHQTAQGSTRELVWVPAYLDPYDGKAFQSAEFLKKHMCTKHAQQLVMDLQEHGGEKGAEALEQLTGQALGLVSTQETAAPPPPSDPSPAAKGTLEELDMPEPRDACEAGAQKLIRNIGQRGNRVSRANLLMYLQAISNKPAECARYGLPCRNEASLPGFSLHDFLASDQVGCGDEHDDDLSPSHASGEVGGDTAGPRADLDWKAVDAHLRVYRELHAYLCETLQRRTATAVDEATSTASKQATEAVMSEVQNRELAGIGEKAEQLFRRIDGIKGGRHKEGYISRGELITAVKMYPDIRDELGLSNVDMDQREAAIEAVEERLGHMDEDHDGRISLKEFKGFMEKIGFFSFGYQDGYAQGLRRGLASASESQEQESELRETNAVALRLFHKLDVEGTGSVDGQAFVHALVQDSEVRAALGLRAGVHTETEEGVDAHVEAAFLRRLDDDGNGAISFDELAAFVDRFREFREGYVAGFRSQPPALPREEAITLPPSRDMRDASTMAALPPREGEAAVETESEAGEEDEEEKLEVGVESAKQESAGLVHEEEKEERSDANDEDADEDDGDDEEASDPAATSSGVCKPGSFVFELQILSCSELSPSDANGLADPCVLVYMDDRLMFETRKNPNKTLDPQWEADEIALLNGLDLNHQPRVRLEVWDRDPALGGVVGPLRKKDFLGMCELTKQDLFNWTGMGPFSLRLQSSKKPEHLRKGRTATVSGSVWVNLHAYAWVELAIEEARDLRMVGRDGTAEPRAVARFTCPGAVLVDRSKKEQKALRTQEQRKANDHEYVTARCPATRAPAWNETKLVRVPLDRDMTPACLEIFHKSPRNHGDMLGCVWLSQETLLCSSGKAGKQLPLLPAGQAGRGAAPAVRVMEGESDESSSSEEEGDDDDADEAWESDRSPKRGMDLASSADSAGFRKGGGLGSSRALVAGGDASSVSSAGKSGRLGPVSGHVCVRVKASKGVLHFMKRNRDLRDSPVHPRNEEDGRVACMEPQLNYMEVEIMILAADNLFRDMPLYALVLLDGNVEVGRTRTTQTGKHVTWTDRLDNRFLVPVPLPADWASLSAPPPTFVVIRLMMDHSVSKDPEIGEVKLPWTALVQPALRKFPLQVTPAMLMSKRGCLGISGTGSRAQGDLTVLIRQRQVIALDLIGACGLAAGDDNISSDPYVEVVCPLLGSGSGKQARKQHGSGSSLKLPHRSDQLQPQWHQRVVFSEALQELGGRKHNKLRRKLQAELGLLEGCRSLTLAGVSVSSDDEAMRDSLPVSLRVWDKDRMGGRTFLGRFDLDLVKLRNMQQVGQTVQGVHRQGICVLPLTDDPQLNRRSLSITGFLEIQLRTSLPLATLSSQSFRRKFGHPMPDRIPMLDIRLSQLRAEGLIAADLNGKSDPYCECKAWGVVHETGKGKKRSVAPTAKKVSIGRTETKSATLAPIWKHAFHFSLPVEIGADADGSSDAVAEPRLDRPTMALGSALASASGIDEAASQPGNEPRGQPGHLVPALNSATGGEDEEEKEGGDNDRRPDAHATAEGATSSQRPVSSDSDRPPADASNAENSSDSDSEDSQSGVEGTRGRSSAKQRGSNFLLGAFGGRGKGGPGAQTDHAPGSTTNVSGDHGKGASPGPHGTRNQKQVVVSPFGTHVRLEVKDADMLGGDDFLGCIELGTAELLKIVEPFPEGGRDLQDKPQSSGLPRRTFEFSLFHGCRSIDLREPTGRFSGEVEVFARFAVRLLEARNVVPVNLMSNTSDPYAKIKIDGEYVMDAKNPKKHARTSTQQNTLNPTWYDGMGSLEAQVDVHKVLNPKCAFKGLSVELWDAPFLAGMSHTFLGRILLTKEELAAWLIDPFAAPFSRALTNDETISPQHKAKKAITGHLQLHISTSLVPAPLLASLPGSTTLLSKARQNEAR